MLKGTTVIELISRFSRLGAKSRHGVFTVQAPGFIIAIDRYESIKELISELLGCDAVL